MIRASIIFLAFFVIAISIWTEKYFGIVTIDQVVSTFHFGMTGAFNADSVFIRRFIKWCLLYPIIFTSLLLFADKFMHFKKKMKISFLLLLYIVGAYLFCHQFTVIAYLKEKNKDDGGFFKNYYVNPRMLSFANTQPKNLVIIYVESLESTYSNKDLFGKDLLTSLNEFKSQNPTSLSIPNYHQLPGTGWTVAAIVATQCGVPLKQLTILNGNRWGEQLKTFLPNAICLSDILANHGYQNIFMSGSSLAIGGKDVFLQTHHYHQIYGKETWLKSGVGPSAFYAWGLADDDLFQRAEQKLTELMREQSPFNLTILTVDTHGLDGQLSHACRDHGHQGFEGIIACDAENIAKFLNFIKSHHWLDKINVVVVGDHLAMKNLVFDRLNQIKKRRIFNLIITSDHNQLATDRMVAFDVFPTLLDLAGFQYGRAEVALGRSIFVKHKEAHYTHRMTRSLLAKSDEYDALWRLN